MSVTLIRLASTRVSLIWVDTAIALVLTLLSILSRSRTIVQGREHQWSQLDQTWPMDFITPGASYNFGLREI